MALFNLKRDAEENEGLVLRELPVELISPNPDQPRRSFDEEGLEELAASIDQVGLIQPLLVRRVGSRYELIAGERRLRAVKLLGKSRVRCLIDEYADEASSALMAIVENLQRQDLHFFEEAECYQALIAKLGLTQEELAARLGKSQSFIANKLRMLRLAPGTRRIVTASGLSERHARALLRLKADEERDEAASMMAAKGLSVKEAEKLVQNMLDGGKKELRPGPRMIRIFRDYKLFMNTVNSACAQLRSSGLKVTVEQSDVAGGVEMRIKVTQ
jgi:ParB family chromosome partitioning protein